MSIPQQPGRTGPPMDRKAAFLNEIKRLTLQASVDPDTFFRAFFERVGAIIEAQGGSMWFHEKASDKLHCRVDSKPKEFASQTPEQETIEKAVLNAIKSDNSILVAPDQGDSALAKALGKESGSSNVLSAMCVPYEIDQESSGALFFYTDGMQRRFDTTDVYLVKQLATYVRAYCLNWKCMQLQQRSAKMDALNKLSTDLHDSLKAEEIAFTIVNMPPDLLAHDRCSLALMKGDKGKIAAVSGQDMVQHRSALIKLLAEIANWVAKKGEVTVVTRQSLDASDDQHFKTLVERYYQDTNMEILLALPIKEEKRTLGVLIFERRNGAPFTGQDLAMVQILTNQVRVALNNARKYYSLPMVSTLETIAKAKEAVTGKQRVKTAIKWSIVAFVLFVLVFVKYPFLIHVPCTISTKDSYNVTARLEGTIKQVFRKEGDIVEEGELIAKMDDRKLQLELIQHQGDLKRLDQERLLNYNDPAKRMMAETDMKNVEQRVKLLQLQIKETELRSTIAGTILTPRLDLLKGRTMPVGKDICQVAPLDPMLLEMEVPEDEIGFMQGPQDLPVREERREGTISQVLVKEGEKVEKGDVIAKIADSKLMQELLTEEAKVKDLEGQLGKKPDADKQKALAAQVAESKKRIRQIEEKLKPTETDFRSPMEGVIIKSPDSLLKRGQPVLADQAVCRMGQYVKYMIDAKPDTEFEGRIDKISQESKIRDSVNVFIATMDVDNKMDPESKKRTFSKGMRGTASIDVGREVVGYILFRKIWNFVRLRVLF